MNEDYSTYEQIDMFLKGNLKGNDLSQFRHKMRSDPEFSETVRAQKVVNEMVVTKHLADLKGKMQQDFQGNGLNKNTKNWKYGLGLAGVLITASIAIWQWNGNEEPKPYLPVQPKTILTTEQEETVQNPNSTEIVDTEKTTSLLPRKPKAIKKDMMATVLAIDTQAKEMVETQSVEKKTEAFSGKQSEIPAPMSKTIDCSGKQWKISIETSPTCLGKSEGAILVFDREKNLYSIDEGTHFVTTKEFNGLPQGSYRLLAKDEYGCEYKSGIEVKTKKCKTLEEFVFNPNLGNWIVPSRDNSNVEVTIVDKSGKMVWTKSYSFLQPEWDGKNNEDQLVPIGLYSFQIKYSDGSTKEGYISVMY